MVNMTDKQQAMKDAITAILQSRQNVGGGGGPQLPPGEIEMPLDPNLIRPNGGAKMPDDVDIKDPDNLIQQQKQTQKDKGSQGGQGKPQDSGKGDPDDDNKGDTWGGDKPQDNPGDEGDPGQTDDGDEEQPGLKPDGQRVPPGDPGEEVEPDDISPDERKGTDPEVSDAFAAAWNEMVDRFDRDDVSDDEIRDLIQKIKMNTIKTI